MNDPFAFLHVFVAAERGTFSRFFHELIYSLRPRKTCLPSIQLSSGKLGDLPHSFICFSMEYLDHSWIFRDFSESYIFFLTFQPVPNACARGLLVFSANSWNVTKTERRARGEKMPAGREGEKEETGRICFQEGNLKGSLLGPGPLYLPFSVSENHSSVSLPHR